MGPIAATELLRAAGEASAAAQPRTGTASPREAARSGSASPERASAEAGFADRTHPGTACAALAWEIRRHDEPDGGRETECGEQAHTIYLFTG